MLFNPSIYLPINQANYSSINLTINQIHLSINLSIYQSLAKIQVPKQLCIKSYLLISYKISITLSSILGWHTWDLNSRLPATIHTENIKHCIKFSVTGNNIHIHITRLQSNPAWWSSITSRVMSYILRCFSKHGIWQNSRCINFQTRLWNTHKRPTQYFANQTTEVKPTHETLSHYTHTKQIM